MLEQEKKEKNLKLWRIAVTVLMLLPMAEMLFVLAVSVSWTYLKISSKKLVPKIVVVPSAFNSLRITFASGHIFVL